MRYETESEFLQKAKVGDWYFRNGHIGIETPSGFALLPIDENCREEWGSPCWEWDGNLDEPTITPSIWINKSKGGWHGWMRKGKLVQA